MNTRTTLLIGLLAAATSGGAGAQITNQDDCASSGADVVGAGTYAFDSSAATTGTQGQNENLCYDFGSSAISNDVWLTYLAGSNAVAVISTCASAGTHDDTKIAAWPGAPACPVDGSALACSDDVCGLYSQIDFPVTAGTSYVIQLGSFPGVAGGTASVSIVEQPVGTPLSNQDECSNASLDVIGPGVFDWNNAGATTGGEGQSEPGCYSFGMTGIQSDVWARYDAGVTGTVRMETCGGIGTLQDTKIAAYPLGPCASIDGTLVACSDDDCSFGLLSSMSFAVSCGESYLVQLGSFPGAQDGTAQLFVTETGPSCAGPIGSTPPNCNPAVTNTTGASAAISAFGSTSASAMDVRLSALNVPNGQPGIFFASRTLGFIANPGGSQGNICVVGSQGRYNMIPQIFFGQGLGSSVPPGGLQVGNLPVPTNPLPGEPIVAGDTWFWQAWHRDVGNNTNFSNVVEVTFTP